MSLGFFPPEKAGPEQNFFYTPVYENIGKASDQATWNWIAKPNLVFREFFNSPTALFEHSKNAKGCYKVELSRADIQKDTSSDSRFLIIPYSAKADQIISYTSRHSKELLNPYCMVSKIQSQTSCTL